jgi:nitroreductase
MKKTLACLLVCSTTICATEKIDPVTNAIKHRHSGYHYDATRAVSTEQLASVLEAGQQAPSSYNDQPWKFIVADKNSNKAAYAKALAGLVEFNQKWAQAAPVLIIIVADLNSREGKFNKYAQYDTGAAAGYMALQAASLGLMAHQMGGFDGDALRTSFEIPQGFEPMAVMALGHEAEDKATRVVKKERKPLARIAFDGDWGIGNQKWNS